MTKSLIERSSHSIDSDDYITESLFSMDKNFQFISAARLGPQLSYPKDDLVVGVFEQISKTEGKSEFVVQFLDEKRNLEVMTEICKIDLASDLFTQVTAWEREISTGVNLYIEDKGLLGYELKYQFSTKDGRTDKFNARKYFYLLF